MQRRPEPTSSTLWWALAVAALLVLGVAGVWQGYASAIRQQHLVESHMGHMAKLMAQSVESAMLRGLRGPGRHRFDGTERENGRSPGFGQGMGQGMGQGPARLSPSQWRSIAQDVLGDLIETGQVASVGIITGYGTYFNLVGAPLAMEDVLTEAAQTELAETGATFGRLGEHDELMVLVRQVQPGMASLYAPERPGNVPNWPTARFFGPFLVVALDMTQHQKEMEEARFAATLQTMFAVGASAAVLLLLAVLVRRHDVSERTKRLEHFQTTLLDAMPEGLFEVDAQGIIVACNTAGARLYAQLDPEHPLSIGRLFTETVLSACTPSDALSDEFTTACHLRQEIRMQGLVLELVSAPLGDNAKLLLLRDRTSRAALEAQVEQSRTLAAIGQMASAVAHEIRNPLSALRGFAQLFVRSFQGRELEESYARTMVAEADRLNRVVSDLLYLTKPTDVQTTLIELPYLAEKVLGLAGLGENEPSLETQLDLQVKTVLADQDALTQALLNALLNAKDAIKALPQHHGKIVVRSFLEDGFATVCVDDNGPGVNEADSDGLFSPFATTKKTGSGLGLAIVRQIMDNHGGSARLERSPEGGARLALRFPVQA